MANEKFKVKFGLAVGDTAATIDGTTGNINTNGTIIINSDQTVSSAAYEAYSGAALGSLTWDGTNWSATGGINSAGATFGNISIGVVTDNTIASTDTNGDIIIQPNGTGDVVVSADTLFLGDGGATANITTSGTGSLFLNTNNSVNSGSIGIIQGVNGTISLDPNGTGVVQVTKNLVVDGDIDIKGGDITNSTGALNIASGGTNTNITLTPNGTGIIDLTKNTTADLGLSVARTVTGGGRAINANGDVLVNNATINTTQLPVAAFFDNTTANRNGRVIVREYGQNIGSGATAATIGNAVVNLEASRGTASAPVSINTANQTIAAYQGGYYDGTRFTSESGIGAPLAIAFQNAEATASETSVFTASISGTTMTVTAVASGAIHAGQLITGTGVANGTSIVSYGNNTFGGTGTYVVSQTQTVVSTTITGVGTTAGGGRMVFVQSPQGNKISNASRQTVIATVQAAPNTQVINGVTVPQNATLNILNGNVETADATYVNSAGDVVYKARGGGSFQIPTLTLNMAGVPFEDRCSFAGYIDNGAGSAGNTLTVTSVVSGVLYVGQRIYAVGLSNTTPYFITALGSGTGLTGTYTIASTFQTAGTLLGSGASPVAMAGTPDDLSLAGKGASINTVTSRKSTVGGRRAPLKNGDGIFSFNIAAQTGALGTNTTANVGNFNWATSEDYTTGAAGSQFFLRTTDIGTTNLNNRLRIDSNNGTLTTNQVVISRATGTGGATLQMSATTGETLLQVGDVNIAQMGSTWQSVFTPGYKYTGLASSSTLTNNGTAFELSSRWKASAGTSTFAPPQTGWGIGTFQFSADASTNNTNQQLAGQIRVAATENWGPTNKGSKITLDANALGTGGAVQVASLSPETSQFNSDIQAFRNGAGSSTYLTLNSTSATFTVPVTTEITTTTISEGTTYTPAATVDNNISVQINVLAGGTTVIDLASLTGNNRGASYNILVFNNTGSGAPIQVKNTRISGSNLMAHTIAAGSPRIIVNAYVVGDYATATYLNVA